MYTDRAVIEEQLMIQFQAQFGDEFKNNVLLLLELLAKKDTYIDNNLRLSLQYLLTLNHQAADYFIKLSLELASASAMAPVLLLEKISTIIFYELMEPIGDFLLNIKDYGGRAIALYLGSDETNTLRVEDLTDVLEQTTVSFYNHLLNHVNAKHNELGVCCAMLMRFAAKIESVIRVDDISLLLNVCMSFIQRYGTKFTEQYIRHVHELVQWVPLTSHINTIEHLSKKSIVYAEFAVRYPTKIFEQPDTKIKDSSDAYEVGNDCLVKIALLEKENYKFFFENYVSLFEDKEFSTLVLTWPTLIMPVKANILFQLKQTNYLRFISACNDINEALMKLNQVTQGRWLDPWMFCEEEINLHFIRKRINKLLQNQLLFSIPIKSIIYANKVIFDRNNQVYDVSRLSTMIDAILVYCNDAEGVEELESLRHWLNGNCKPLRAFLSYKNLVIQTWGRDPWSDYGRSDELFSCTGFGDYNSGNAPCFLADLNLSNLDIWANGNRIGRIRFCLTKNSADQTILLLDCVDGSERALISHKKAKAIIAAVFQYTKWLGVRYIKFNYDVDFNTTPKRFIDTIQTILKQVQQVEFMTRFLKISTQRRLIPYPGQTFLESFMKDNGAFVRGALVDIENQTIEKELSQSLQTPLESL